ncbi:hypothetical protein [Pedobacter sp. SYP-B3415]|uniref:hypothetical protein n=1 Tax=Pedobacter sp. SYP-B3415 TaxID=2496641 RepID=UPI00101BDC8B|nr:hypothetical protein [Pedobacter sp. SYP-B3415]
MEFSLKRIWLLLNLQWTENRKFYFWIMLGLPVVMAVVFSFASFALPDGLSPNYQTPVFVGGLIITSWIFSTSVFSVYTSSLQNRKTLSIPASAQEKTFLSILFGVVLFPVFYCLVVFPTLYLTHYIDTEWIGNINSFMEPDFNVLVVLPCVLLPLMLLNALFTLIFKKYAFFKSVALTVALFVSINYVNQRAIDLLSGKEVPQLSPATAKMLRDHHLAYNRPGVGGSAFTNWSVNLQRPDAPYTGVSASVVAPKGIFWIPALLYIFCIISLYLSILYKIREATT